VSAFGNAFRLDSMLFEDDIHFIDIKQEVPIQKDENLVISRIHCRVRVLKK
jgi:hypothetical protein